MSAPTLTSQTAVRAFAFGDQEHQPAALPADPRSTMSPRARDLHGRADLMFRCGYQASGWTLRQAAWQAEGRA